MTLHRFQIALTALLLVLAPGAALANPGMGGMGGSEAHHHAGPSPQPQPAPPPPPPPQKQPKSSGCSSCGGGSHHGSHISPNDARQRAADAADDAMDNDGIHVTIGSGGRLSESLSGAITSLADAEKANKRPLPPGFTAQDRFIFHRPLPPTPPGELTPEQIWNAPAAPPKPPPAPAPEDLPTDLQNLLNADGPQGLPLGGPI